MQPVPSVKNEALLLKSRIVHGPRVKLAFNRTMDVLGGISPSIAYSLRTSLREAAFPLRPNKSETCPELRDDVTRYADLYREATANFEKVLSPYQDEINWPRARVYNGIFETVDAELYYCMIRSLRPTRVIEVGAGNSTWFARDALRANKSGQVWAIDPSPRLVLPKECRHLRRLVQEVGISVFQELRESDILFVDSSHSEEEANYFVERIYPVLRPGVFIHHHDIVFPYRGYAAFVPDWESLGESNVVLEFLRQNQDSYSVFAGSAFAQYKDPSLVLRLIPSKVHRPLVAGGSIWILKKA